jgi:hypothetical protein
MAELIADSVFTFHVKGQVHGIRERLLSPFSAERVEFVAEASIDEAAESRFIGPHATNQSAPRERLPTLRSEAAVLRGSFKCLCDSRFRLLFQSPR